MKLNERPKVHQTTCCAAINIEQLTAEGSRERAADILFHMCESAATLIIPRVARAADADTRVFPLRLATKSISLKNILIEWKPFSSLLFVRRLHSEKAATPDGRLKLSELNFSARVATNFFHSQRLLAVSCKPTLMHNHALVEKLVGAELMEMAAMREEFHTECLEKARD